MPIVSYKLTPPISTKFFNLNKFVNGTDVHLFSTNTDNLPSSCNNYAFTNRHHKHIVAGDLRVFKNSIFRNIFIKGPKYREVRTIHLERVKCCLLEDHNNCISRRCCKNGVDKSFSLEWTNN